MYQCNDKIIVIFFFFFHQEGLLDVEKLECEDELTGTEISCLRLKGQMIYLPEADNILFLCSPRYFKSCIILLFILQLLFYKCLWE